MIKFKSKRVREEMSIGGLVAMCFGYGTLFCVFAVLYVAGDYPAQGIRAMVLSGLVGAAGNLFWLMNRDGQ